MSSVPAARIDHLARRPALRLIPTNPVELYPTFFQTLRAAWRRAPVGDPPGRTLAELGRSTGARI